MKRRINKMLLLLVLTFVIINMEGCAAANDNAAENPLNLVIVGATIRANQPVFNDSKIREEIMTACLTCGTVTLIAVDGDPYLVAAVDIPTEKSGMSASKYKQIAENQTNQIMTLMEQNNKAVADEADLLSALQLASRELNAHEGIKKLVIADSGLSTKGYIDLTSFELLDTDAVIQNLKMEEALPDLSSCEALWIGLGDVTGKQPKLLQKDRKCLQKLWTGILTESGAQLTILTDSSVCQELDEALPDVHVVSVSQPVILAQKDMDVQKIFQEEKAIVFDEKTLNFKPGTDELLSDERDVKSLIEPVVEYLKKDCSNRIVLLGTTASAGKDNDLFLLSMNRCNVLKRILISCGGIEDNQIEIYGLGYQKARLYGLTIGDTDENGNFIEELGQRNRQVLITYRDSELAQKVITAENVHEEETANEE